MTNARKSSKTKEEKVFEEKQKYEKLLTTMIQIAKYGDNLPSGALARECLEELGEKGDW